MNSLSSRLTVLTLAATIAISACVARGTSDTSRYTGQAMALIPGGIECPSTADPDTTTNRCVNLRRYLPDGPSTVSDDNDRAFQSALAELGVAQEGRLSGCCVGTDECGGTIFIPPGVYSVSKPIRIGPVCGDNCTVAKVCGDEHPAPSVHLIGSGRQTVLAPDSSFAGPIIHLSSYVNLSVIESLVLSGDQNDPACAQNIQLPPSNDSSSVGILGEGPGNAGTLRDLLICHFGTGVRILGTWVTYANATMAPEYRGLYRDDIDFIEVKYNNIGISGASTNGTIYQDIVATGNNTGIILTKSGEGPSMPPDPGDGQVWSGGLIQNSVWAGMWVKEAQDTNIDGFMFRRNALPSNDLPEEEQSAALFFARKMESPGGARNITVVNSYFDSDQKVVVLNQSPDERPHNVPAVPDHCPYRSLALEDMSGPGMEPVPLDIHLPHRGQITVDGGTTTGKQDCTHEYHLEPADFTIQTDGKMLSHFRTDDIDAAEDYYTSATPPKPFEALMPTSTAPVAVSVLLPDGGVEQHDEKFDFGFHLFGDGTVAVGEVKESASKSADGMFVNGPLHIIPDWRTDGARCELSDDIGRLRFLEAAWLPDDGFVPSRLYFCTRTINNIQWQEVEVE